MDRRTRQRQEALARGADHHRAGRWREAAAAYADALRADPESADAYALLAAVLLRLGRTGEALACAERAVAREPTHAVAHLNRGRALLAVDRAADALAAFEAARAARPDFPDAEVGRARALAALGRHTDAEATLDALARVAPDHPGIGALRAAAARDHGLATLGAPEAVERLARALALAPNDRRARLGLADALHLRPDAARSALLVALFDAEDVDHQRLARAAEHLVRAAWSACAGGTPDADRAGPDTPLDAPVAGAASQDASSREAAALGAALREPAALARAATDPVLLGWLRRTVVASPWGHALVRALRRAVLRAAADGEPPLVLAEALAIQAWNTEHADVEPTDEALAATLIVLPSTPARIAALATVHPPSGPLHPALATLARVARDEPAAEGALAPDLPSLAPLADPTSCAVAAMYEENPYPRLVGVHRREPVPFHAYVRAAVPTLSAGFPLPARPRVLVAGGGTGQHPLSVAAAVADADVLAIDLSRASLARAARLARAHGVANVRFLHGDLLALGTADTLGAFDFVDSVGVLHHLDTPLAGLRALVARLAPGALLRVGLYSERGRADVVAARALAAEHGWLPTPEGLRAARAALLALPPEHPAASLAASPDLYSQSGLRDLVFHVREHRFTPLQVRDLLDAAGLIPLGLQHSRPDARAHYAARWPDDPAQADLARWDTLEAELPRIFSGMIHVWSRLRG